MGTHWTDWTSHEFHGETFTSTLVYGFYDATMVFMEPMLTRAFLQRRPDETKTVSVPAHHPEAGRLPTSYRMWYDAASSRYRIDLTDFVTRS